MAKKDLATASVLAFERKLDCSDALMSSGKWADRAPSKIWPAIALQEKSVRGTISNRQGTKGQDPAKLDAQIQVPNLQRVDVANLPASADTLCLAFTLRVIGGAGTPSACNDSAYQARLKETVDTYVAKLGFSELSKRYATTLATGRFLWRNRIGAEMCETHVELIKDGKVAQAWIFDSFALQAGAFPSVDKKVGELAAVIADGLAGKKHVLLSVVAYARLGGGQEVFPSQELILDKGSKGKGVKSKTLYQVGGSAAMHSQKIGNALRTIDTWYPDSDGHPIAVEPFGSVTSEGRAYRQPKAKADFYNLLDAWVLKDVAPAPEQQHYVIANLIRGGVFGEAEKD